MVQIEFDNNQMITKIQANLGDLFKDVINKYLAKSLISPENVSFFANGSIINPNLTVEKQMNNLDKDNKTMKVIYSTTEKKRRQDDLMQVRRIKLIHITTTLIINKYLFPSHKS